MGYSPRALMHFIGELTAEDADALKEANLARPRAGPAAQITGCSSSSITRSLGQQAATGQIQRTPRHGTVIAAWPIGHPTADPLISTGGYSAQRLALQSLEGGQPVQCLQDKAAASPDACAQALKGPADMRSVRA